MARRNTPWLGDNPRGYDMKELNTLITALSGKVDPSFALGLFSSVSGDVSQRHQRVQQYQQQRQQARQQRISTILDQVLQAAQGGATYGQAQSEAGALAGLLHADPNAVQGRIGALYPAHPTTVGEAISFGGQHPADVQLPATMRSKGSVSPLFGIAQTIAQNTASKTASTSPQDRYQLKADLAQQVGNQVATWASAGLPPKEIMRRLQTNPATSLLLQQSPEQMYTVIQSGLARGGSANSRHVGPSGGNPVGGSSAGGRTQPSGTPSGLGGIVSKSVGSFALASLLGKTIAGKVGFSPTQIAAQDAAAMARTAGEAGLATTGAETAAKFLGPAGIAAAFLQPFVAGQGGIVNEDQQAQVAKRILSTPGLQNLGTRSRYYIASVLRKMGIHDADTLNTLPDMIVGVSRGAYGGVG